LIILLWLAAVVVVVSITQVVAVQVGIKLAQQLPSQQVIHLQ
jgi:hypothetical protein